MRFIHCADLHLGKPFGRFDEDTRVELRGARLQTLDTIGQIALSHNAPYVLIAGDTFDAETPPSKLVRRALDAMAKYDGVTWILMPGNHDSLAASDLWDRIARDCPPNIILALEPTQIELQNAVVLPAPPTNRSAGFDLTEWMVAAETGEKIRIGLAHGGVTNFGSEDGGLDTIPPDRAKTADLDYLALGDWHGQMQISDRCWYSGTPEPDGYKHSHAAGVLLVEINDRHEPAIVTPLPTGQYVWKRIEIDFFAGNDPIEVLTHAFPDKDRSKYIIRFSGTGRLRLLELAALRNALSAMIDEFHHMEFDLSRIDVEQNIDDLNLIAETGALRVAAETLAAQTTTDGRTEEDAQIAKLALSHLFHLAQEVTS